MARRIFLLFLLAAAATHCFGERPNRSPELLLLDRLVGTWDVEYEFKVDNQAVRRESFRTQVEWSRDGNFVIANDLHDVRERLTVFRFDSLLKQYRGVVFSSTDQGAFEATWDDATKTFTMTFEESTDANVTVVHRFIDQDQIELRMEVRGK
ncbi:MAG: hypothetical protein AAFX06_34250, partial [Planctomycetota bacterium]